MAAATITAKNPARERLQKGELALGVGLRQARTVDIAPILKSCGYDWLFIEQGDDRVDLVIDTKVRPGTEGDYAGNFRLETTDGVRVTGRVECSRS